jgi:hypothetical protein
MTVDRSVPSGETAPEVLADDLATFKKSVEDRLGTQFARAGGGNAGRVVAEVARSATQAISDSTVTNVTWDTEITDVGTFVDIAGQPTRVTIPAGWAGSYLVVAQLRFAGSATGVRELVVNKNGAALPWSDNQPGAATAGNYHHLTFPVTLAVGDYVTATAYQTSGGSLNLQTGNFVRMSLIFLHA